MTKHIPPMSGLHFVGEDADGNPIWSGLPVERTSATAADAAGQSVATALSSEPKPNISVSCGHSPLPETVDLLSRDYQ